MSCINTVIQIKQIVFRYLIMQYSRKRDDRCPFQDMKYEPSDHFFSYKQSILLRSRKKSNEPNHIENGTVFLSLYECITIILIRIMGNCASMSATAESSVAMTRRSVSDGTEEAAMIFSNGMITSMRVSVCAIKVWVKCSYPLNVTIYQIWIL